jgi:anaerobic selenocysteine-containing dehydrogenase
MHPADLAARGLAAGERIDITSHFQGQIRVAQDFVVVPYAIPRRCAAAYFPEANVLVPLDSYADKSRTPTSKSIPITVARRATSAS